MTLLWFLRAIRARWITVVLLAICGGILGGVVGQLWPKTYAATSAIVIRWVATNNGIAEHEHAQYATNVAKAYVVLAGNPVVLDETLRSLDLDMTPGELRSRLAVTHPRDSQLIMVRATSGDPREASSLSREAAQQIAYEIGREEGRGALRAAQVDALVGVEAPIPTAHVAPRRTMFAVVGLLGGLSLGVAWAAVAGYSLGRSSRLPSSPSPSAVGPGALWGLPKPRLIGAHIVWLMLMATTIPWRNDVLYEGGADPVVVAKGAISIGAAAIAGVLAYRSRDSLHPIPVSPAIILSAYLMVTVVGGLADGDLAAALVVAIRVLVLLVAVYFLALRYGPKESARSLIHILAIITVAAVTTGLAGDFTRLAGGFPPLKPNALAFFASVLCVWVMAKTLSGRDSTLDICLVVALLFVVLLTGSRTSLFALVVALVVMIPKATAVSRRAVALFAVALPCLIYLLLGTDVIQSVVMRGGEERLSTLSNRTIAWEAAFAMDRDVWQTWFGQGLAQKMIDVPGQWWDTQLLDGTWVSALVQGGILGLVLVSILSLTTVVRAVWLPRSESAVWLGLAVLTTVRGFLESGLFDSTTAFLIFAITAIGVRATRGEPDLPDHGVDMSRNVYRLPAGSSAGSTA